MSINKIDEHKFSDSEIFNCDSTSDPDMLQLAISSYPSVEFYLKKEDAIAIAKHFKLTADDLNCQTMCKTNCKAIKNMQDEMDMADEIHFDELVECRANVVKTNKRLS